MTDLNIETFVPKAREMLSLPSTQYDCDALASDAEKKLEHELAMMRACIDYFPGAQFMHSSTMGNGHYYNALSDTLYPATEAYGTPARIGELPHDPLMVPFNRTKGDPVGAHARFGLRRLLARCTGGCDIATGYTGHYRGRARLRRALRQEYGIPELPFTMHLARSSRWVGGSVGHQTYEAVHIKMANKTAQKLFAPLTVMLEMGKRSGAFDGMTGPAPQQMFDTLSLLDKQGTLKACVESYYKRIPKRAVENALGSSWGLGLERCKGSVRGYGNSYSISEMWVAATVEESLWAMSRRYDGPSHGSRRLPPVMLLQAAAMASRRACMELRPHPVQRDAVRALKGVADYVKETLFNATSPEGFREFYPEG